MSNVVLRVPQVLKHVSSLRLVGAKGQAVGEVSKSLLINTMVFRMRRASVRFCRHFVSLNERNSVSFQQWSEVRVYP